MIRAPIPRTFRRGKRNTLGNVVSYVVHRQTHLTSRPTWNDSTGRCGYELTNNIKYLTGELIGRLVRRLFLHLAKHLKTARAHTHTLANDNYFRRQREPFHTSFFFFFFSLLLCDQSFWTYPSDHQKPLDNYPNGLGWLEDRLFSMIVGSI